MAIPNRARVGPNFPVAPPQYSQTWMSQLIDTVKRAFIPVVTSVEGVDHILLVSPNGSVYEVVVSNSGVISTSLMSGSGTKPPLG